MKFYYVGYIFLLLAIVVLIIGVTAKLIKPYSDISAAPATEQVAMDYIVSMNQREVKDVVGAMNSVEYSREEATSESIAESQSESVSIAESIAQSEAESIAESIAESVAESEAESIKESIQESVQESIRESIAQSEAASIAESAAEESRRWDELIRNTPVGEDESGLTLGKLHEGDVMNITMADVPAIRKLFANTVIIGDSRAKTVVITGILTENEVSYYGGACVYALHDTTAAGAKKMRKKALFVVGLNDLGGYHGDAKRFKNDLKQLIGEYLAINPNSKIYLQDILPVLESGRYAWPNMDFRPAFNQAIVDLCNEMGYGYVSVSKYALPKYVNSRDGAHYDGAFYLLWTQAVANQMGLWEDLK